MKYKTGNFSEVISRLTQCLHSGYTNPKFVEEAYSLLAKTYIELDMDDSAYHYTNALLTLNPNFEPALDDPYRFKENIDAIKNSKKVTTVTSVSKKAENIREVPATVMVITDDDIIKRGYQGFEQILHDLPGFDISKGSGPAYTSFYQRGYRSVNNDRTLLLIDGIEDNDLVSDNIQISRQFSLSDIKRVEVIYGPSSTMYGANAYIGVINVITKDATDYLGENKKLGVNASIKYSSWNTRCFDGTVTGRICDISVSVTGRLFYSEEPDLSVYPEWNYNSRVASDYTSYQSIFGVDATGNFLAQNYIDKNKLTTTYPNSNLFSITYDQDGKATRIDMTETGKEKAANLDNKIFGSTIKSQNVVFDDHTFNWYFKIKMQIKDLTIGLISWKTEEGAIPWYTNYSRIGTRYLTRWMNWNRSFYLNYSKKISDKITISNLASYKLHEIDGGTNYVTYKGYYNKGLSFLELAKEISPSYSVVYNYRVSTQLRNELKCLYTPFKNLDIMSGFEYRSNLIQGNYVITNAEYPEETGVPADSVTLLRGGNHFKSYDAGLYSQATYNPFEKFKIIVGGRLDYNVIREHGGYGWVFNPRFALVYSPTKFVFKLIYSEAFKDASNFDKYATTKDRKLNNPTLQPEKVKNIELSAFCQLNTMLSIEIVGYSSYYSNVIGNAIVTLPTGEVTTQFQPLGNQEIKGIQATIDFRLEPFTTWANFTYTNPIDKISGLRISDIADFAFNIGACIKILKKIDFNIITNYIGTRKSGIGTYGSKNPITSFEPTCIFNSTITYNNLFSGINLQFTMNNIFDKEYFAPGVREADGKTYASKFLQDRRNVAIGLQINLK